jgi:three-Cys-motif partner protein
VARERSEISEIGYWSEVKLDIIRDYAGAYSRILTAQQKPNLHHVYIDAFSGAGFHKSRGTGALVWGSPTSVLLVDPPFKEYHFIDLDEGNIDVLEQQVRSRTQGPYDPDDVHFYNADCNKVLLSQVFPRVRFEDYRRALCLLDPYGLDLDWQVILAAGQAKSIEVFLNFPIMDINRNALWRDKDKVTAKQRERLTRYWGDESWRSAAYSSEGDLFGFEKKVTNEAVAEAFGQRLATVAGFSYVPAPMPMRNSKGAVVYYLFFASQNKAGAKIVQAIFDKYKDRSH